MSIPSPQSFPSTSDSPIGMLVPPSIASFLQCPDWNQLWQVNHLNLQHYFAQQSLPLRLSPPSDRQVLQWHYSNAQQNSNYGSVPLVDAHLPPNSLQPGGYCPPSSFQFGDGDPTAVTALGSQETSVPLTAMVSAAQLWDPPTFYLFPFLKAAPSSPAVQMPLPSCASASDKLSALLSTLQGGASEAPMVDACTLQLSAQSAFEYVKQPSPKGCVMTSLPTPTVGNCVWVEQKQPTQERLGPPIGVGGKQQLTPSAAQQFQLGEDQSTLLCLKAAIEVSHGGGPLSSVSAQSMDRGVDHLKTLGAQQNHSPPTEGNKLPGKGQWRLSEDKSLSKLVNIYGTRRWSLIATFMTNRSGKQCRERWVNHLQPNIRKECWTVEEEELLVQAHSTFGNRWSAIAKMLPGRTDNSIKNHWHSALRKKGRHRPSRPSLLRDYIQQKTTATVTTSKAS